MTELPRVLQDEMNAPLVADADFRPGLRAARPPALGRAAGDRRAAVFLASSAADYVTGHVLYVDGGFSAAISGRAEDGRKTNAPRRRCEPRRSPALFANIPISPDGVVARAATDVKGGARRAGSFPFGLGMNCSFRCIRESGRPCGTGFVVYRQGG